MFILSFIYLFVSFFVHVFVCAYRMYLRKQTSHADSVEELAGARHNGFTFFFVFFFLFLFLLFFFFSFLMQRCCSNCAHYENTPIQIYRKFHLPKN